jgi:hypothetical protein
VGTALVACERTDTSVGIPLELSVGCQEIVIFVQRAESGLTATLTPDHVSSDHEPGDGEHRQPLRVQERFVNYTECSVLITSVP